MFIAATAATMALATPLDKRTVVETEVVVEYYTVTVTAGEEPATSTTSVSQPTVFVNGGKHKSWSKWSTSTVVQAPTSTTTPEVVYVTSTYVPEVEPVASTTVAEATTEEATTEAAPTSTQAASTYVEVPASTSTSATTASPSDMASTALYAHNLHRANHSASALEWLEEIAGYAETTANSCTFAHDM